PDHFGYRHVSSCLPPGTQLLARPAFHPRPDGIPPKAELGSAHPGLVGRALHRRGGVMVGLVPSSQHPAAPRALEAFDEPGRLSRPTDRLRGDPFPGVSDQDRSREFYRSVFGATVLLERDPVILRLANSW